MTKLDKPGRVFYTVGIGNNSYSFRKKLISMSRKANIAVHVSGNIERSLRQLKKKIEREGIVRDMKRTVYFESPTQKRRKRLVRAIKQNLLRMISNKS